jgi:P-type Cu2+ transporter
MHRTAKHLVRVGQSGPIAERGVAPAAAWNEDGCAHCGLDVPAGRRRAAGLPQFCCGGCEAVYAAICGNGLQAYYRIREHEAAKTRPAAVPTSRYEAFDNPQFLEQHARASGDGLLAIELALEGVHCAACVWLVERLPQVCPGVVESRLDFARSTARVSWDASKVRLSKVASSLASLGYQAHPSRDCDAVERRRREDRRMLVRIAAAGAIAGNVMLLAFALYSAEAGRLAPEFERFFRVASAALGGLSLAWPGSLFFRGAWAALRTGAAHLDVPIALGLAAGGVAGVANTILGRGEIYFDSLTVLVFLLLVGRWVQRCQQRRAHDALGRLYALTPAAARVVGLDDVVREIPIEAIQIGDTVEVLAAETIPVDGVVLAGESAVDASMLTGESLPAAVGPKARVLAGAVNLSATLRVRAEATGQATRAGKLAALVAREASNPAPIVRQADRIAGRFTLAVIALAAATFLFWLPISPARAIDNASALLIVTCPCALGLATPMILTVAIGRAARQRVLIKGGDALEQLAGRGRICFDKTGTITEGRLRVVEIVSLGAGVDDARLFDDLVALESHSAHPAARAIVARLGPAGELCVSHVRQDAGGGIEGCVAGRLVAAGSLKFMRTWLAARGLAFGGHEQGVVEGMISRALSPVIVAGPRGPLAVLGLGDPIREDARPAIDALRRLGWEVTILSGDQDGVVKGVARELGVAEEQARGGVWPDEKLEIVKAARRDGPVVMVGDGVNDAAALAAATLGIAVQGGAEASLAAAGVYLDKPGLAPIVDIVKAGRRTLRTIRTAIGVSLLYNATAAALAVSGTITPLLAAVLMPLSSLSVVALALSGRAFRRAAAP